MEQSKYLNLNDEQNTIINLKNKENKKYLLMKLSNFLQNIHESLIQRFKT